MSAPDPSHPTTAPRPRPNTPKAPRPDNLRIAILVALALTLAAPRLSTAAGIREARRNFIGSELVGRNIISLNYERMITNQFGLGGGIGIGGYMYVSSLSGDTHSLYLSAGVAAIPDLFALSPGPALHWFLQGSVGYQFQSSGGFFMRPLLSLNLRLGTNPGFVALPGLTVGGAF